MTLFIYCSFPISPSIGIWGWRISFLMTSGMAVVALIFWYIFAVSKVIHHLNVPTQKSVAEKRRDIAKMIKLEEILKNAELKLHQLDVITQTVSEASESSVGSGSGGGSGGGSGDGSKKEVLVENNIEMKELGNLSTEVENM